MAMKAYKKLGIQDPRHAPPPVVAQWNTTSHTLCPRLRLFESTINWAIRCLPIHSRKFQSSELLRKRRKLSITKHSNEHWTYEHDHGQSLMTIDHQLIQFEQDVMFYEKIACFFCCFAIRLNRRSPSGINCRVCVHSNGSFALETLDK